MLCNIKAGFRENGGFELGIWTHKRFQGEVANKIITDLGAIGIRVDSRVKKVSCYRLDVLSLPKTTKRNEETEVMMNIAAIATADIAGRGLEREIQTLMVGEELFELPNKCAY